MSPEAAATNEWVLAHVERLGGGYVWDAEIFTVSLIDVAASDEEARKLCALTGVQQLALNGAQLSLATLKAVASIPGLNSLVLVSPSLEPAELATLMAIGPRITVIEQ